MLDSIDHINIVVNHLDTMVRFYTELLGLKITNHATISGQWIERVVGLANVKAEVVYVSPPNGPRIELLKYHSPAGDSPAGLGASNTRGIRHIALRVTGIDEMVARLRTAGVGFLDEVQLVPTAQVTYVGGVRKRLVYFHDPEGNLLELCEYSAAAS